MTPEGIWVNKSKNDVRQIQRVLIMLILSPWEYRDKEGFVLWRPLWLWQIKKDEASIFREFLFLFLLLKFLLEAICRVSTDLSEWKLSCSTKGQLWQSVLTQALCWLSLTVKCTHSVTDWTEHTPASSLKNLYTRDSKNIFKREVNSSTSKGAFQIRTESTCVRRGLNG